MMFDTSVQELKYKVLREVARLAFEDRLEEGMLDIANIIDPDRCPLCAAVFTRNALSSTSA